MRVAHAKMRSCQAYVSYAAPLPERGSSSMLSYNVPSLNLRIKELFVVRYRVSCKHQHASLRAGILLRILGVPIAYTDHATIPDSVHDL